MTDRERILVAVRGEVADRLPWVPRLEFWYRARLRDGTLPAELRPLTLTEIADRLGMGCYSSVPDFTECPGANDMVDRALGIFQVPVISYEMILDGKPPRPISQGAREDSVTLVGLGRIELPTSPLSGVRSSQLSYRPKLHLSPPRHSPR